MQAVLVAFGAVFVAELGDKSQLVALTLATKFRPLPVLAGIAVAIAVLQALAVGVGAAMSEALPDRLITVVAGLGFLAMAAWTLRPEDDEPEDDALGRGRRSAAVTAASAFFLSEFGDKTQLATLALASTNGVVGTWIGASTGELAADAIAVAVGVLVGARLPDRPLRYLSAALFAVFGAVLLFRG